jgi:hypothetical protein
MRAMFKRLKAQELELPLQRNLSQRSVFYRHAAPDPS